MDKRTFAGITFKPTKTGAVRWSQVAKMLRSGRVECTWWTPSNPQSTVSEASSVLRQVEITGRPSRCRVGQHGNYDNPRYKGQRFVQLTFHSNSFVTLYDLSELSEPADGTEVDEAVECEACVGCEVQEDDPPAIVLKGGLRLVVSN